LEADQKVDVTHSLRKRCALKREKKLTIPGANPTNGF
jgi:hypothetical protein